MPEKPSDAIAVEVISEVVNETAKAAVTIIVGADPLTAAAVGGLAGGTATAIGRLIQRRRDQLGTFVDAASQHGGNFEQLVEAALEDDRKLGLLRRAIEAAYKATESERVRLYARLTAEGILAADDALVDEKDRVLSSIATLDPPDLKVLLHMSTADAWKMCHAEGANPKTVALDLPEVEPVLDAVVARLQTLGLISDASEGGLSFGSQWYITEFGHRCIRELRSSPEHTGDDHAQG